VPDDPLNLAEFSCTKHGIQFHGERRREFATWDLADSPVESDSVLLLPFMFLALLVFTQSTLVILIVAL
jgi:hypothetical protein